MDEQGTDHDDSGHDVPLHSDAERSADGHDPWHDDLLDRRGFADFLGKVLVEQARVLAERQQRGLTVALDAEWGAGKTFFIERWADSLRRQGHPVVMFDAWKHDLGEAPSIVLMAAIDEALREWFGKTSIEAATKEKARALGRSGIRQLRRAVMPTAGVVLSGLLKKTTGIAWKDIRGAIATTDDDDDDTSDTASSPDAENGDADDDSQAKIDAGLDRIFEKALGEQTQRIEAIARFREDMGRVIDLIRSDAAARMPVFVFVDELDRCRPSYAISLLEEIKHIFGMPNVCFVVSTNLAQLSHSVRAVYGQGFDAEHYLKRFFDQTHAIPLPDSRRHIEMLLAEHPVLAGRMQMTGLPSFQNRKPSAADAIAHIFDACLLDLRSQKQVFRIAEIAVIVMDVDKQIVLLWLFFLATLIHKDQGLYLELLTKKPENEGFRKLIATVLIEDKPIYHFTSRKIGMTKLSDVLTMYHEWSHMRADAILDFSERNNLSDYPISNLQQVINDLPGSWRSDTPPRPFIHHYINLVRYAGYNRTPVE